MDVDLVVTGARLRGARERIGQGQRALAKAAGVSQTILSRLEAGIPTRASLEQLDRIAQVLGVNMADLLYGSAVRDRVQAAARATTGTDVHAGLERAIDLLELDDALDAIVPDLRQQRVSPQFDVPTVGGAELRGQSMAEQSRARLQLGVAPIADLPELLEQLTGVDVGTAPLNGASGICAVDPARHTSVVLVDCSEVADRQRFTLAHELGHLLFGDGAHVDAVDGKRTQSEIRCDAFARHLLIPQTGVTAWLTRAVGGASKGLVDERTIAQLARHFAVTPEVARIQLDRMKLLPAAAASLPTGRTLAYRYGWGPQYDTQQEAASIPRAPRRLLDRATEAYRAGKLGVAVLARLEGRPISEVAQALADAGIAAAPHARRVNMDALIARTRPAS